MIFIPVIFRSQCNSTVVCTRLLVLPLYSAKCLLYVYCTYCYGIFMLGNSIIAPMNTTACIGGYAFFPCQFNGTDPDSAISNWRIIMRDVNGSAIYRLLSGSQILNNSFSDLHWENSTLLRVGPVNQSFNLSSYQCVIPSENGAFSSGVESGVGILTVAGKYVLV